MKILKTKPGICLIALAVLFGSISGAAAASLAWDAVSGDVTGYNVYYGTDPGNLSKHIDVGNATKYSLDGLSLSQGTKYFFAVTAYNSAGESEYSNQVAWTPGDTTPPAPPRGFAAR